MKRKPINRYSLKKIAELNAEAPIRVELCRRAHGYPETYLEEVYIKGKRFNIMRVLCRNGICEICHKEKPVLEPHEKVRRSRGGKLSMENTLMVDRTCHIKAQKSFPMWSKSRLVEG